MGWLKNRRSRERREPELISTHINAILDEWGIEENFNTGRILSEWSDIVGKSVATNTRPHKIEKYVLIVNVSNSAWLMELSRFYKKDILNKIKNIDKTIKQVVFKLGPIKG